MVNRKRISREWPRRSYPQVRSPCPTALEVTGCPSKCDLSPACSDVTHLLPVSHPLLRELLVVVLQTCSPQSGARIKGHTDVAVIVPRVWRDPGIYMLTSCELAMAPVGSPVTMVDQTSGA